MELYAWSTKDGHSIRMFILLDVQISTFGFNFNSELSFLFQVQNL